MDDFERLYKEKVIKIGCLAFEDIIKYCTDEIKSKTPLMIEYARHGENYLDNDKVKLMVVGRAPGNFGEKTKCSVIDYNSMTYNEKTIEYCFSEHYYEKEKLNWIHDDNVRKGRRCIDSFPFFSFSKKVYLKLANQNQDFEWYKNICYSNIFKIVSLKGGNPSNGSRFLQEKYMLEIFMSEIDFYKPTHILVLDSETDEHCWCSADFKNKIKTYAKNNDTKICFCNRPEFRKTIDLMAIVDRDFDIK